jgi:hypothetical protein
VLIARDGFAHVALQEQDIAEIGVGVGVCGGEAHDGTEVFGGGGEALGAGKDETEFAVGGEIVGGETEQGAEMSFDVRGLTSLLGEEGELAVGVGVTGRETDGRFEERASFGGA